jgi:general secretion pathway protein B
MSFILDALKKSEMERQRQAIPGLMDSAGKPPRPRFPLWAAALASLFAINLIVLAVVLWGHNTPAQTASKSPATGNGSGVPAAVSVRAAPAPEHFSPMEGTPTYAPEIPVVGAGHAATAAAPRQYEPALRPGNAALDRDQSSQDEALPSISELNLSGTHALPELHLDVHVFATNSADRFVYINMQRYREGSRLQEGPILERIRRDGVILNYEGLRFLLPRQ